MSIIPMAVYGLSVEPHGIPIPAEGSMEGAFTITMAAIDPTETPEVAEGSSKAAPARATLKLIRQPLLDLGDDDSDASFDQDEMDALLAEEDSEEDEESSDGETDEKAADGMTKKERNLAVAAKLKAALEADGMEVDIPNGIKKAKADAEDDEDDEDDDEDDDDESIEADEEFVICTLDAEKNFQQPINITIGADEEVYFKVDGNVTIHLTGNYVALADEHDHDHDDSEDEDDEDMYGMYPGAEDLDDSEDGESDELDDLDDPRIMEVSDEEAEAPVLIESKKSKKADAKKGKNKRAAEESPETPAAAESLDELIAKADGEQKLSKKQLKKLKANDGKAVPVAAEGTPDKKVQFAEKLVQGPTKTATGPTVIKGVTVDDKKAGDGKPAKNGSTVAMRYIGKLKGGKEDGKVFDSNKSGKPFTFKLGKGDVIKGWEVGIAGIKAGGERRLTVPASMAYGNSKVPGIPPNSTLTFDVKCLEVK